MSDIVTFILDGREVEALPEETIWQTAKRLGTTINITMTVATIITTATMRPLPFFGGRPGLPGGTRLAR